MGCSGDTLFIQLNNNKGLKSFSFNLCLPEVYGEHIRMLQVN